MFHFWPRSPARPHVSQGGFGWLTSTAATRPAHRSTATAVAWVWSVTFFSSSAIAAAAAFASTCSARRPDVRLQRRVVARPQPGGGGGGRIQLGCEAAHSNGRRSVCRWDGGGGAGRRPQLRARQQRPARPGLCRPRPTAVWPRPLQHQLRCRRPSQPRTLRGERSSSELARHLCVTLVAGGALSRSKVDGSRAGGRLPLAAFDCSRAGGPAAAAAALTASSSARDLGRTPNICSVGGGDGSGGGGGGGGGGSGSGAGWSTPSGCSGGNDGRGGAAAFGGSWPPVVPGRLARTRSRSFVSCCLKNPANRCRPLGRSSGCSRASSADTGTSSSAHKRARAAAVCSSHGLQHNCVTQHHDVGRAC